MLESIANPLAYFMQIGDYGDDEIHGRYLFDDDSEFINNLVSIKSGGKFTNKLDTYTFCLVKILQSQQSQVLGRHH